MHTLPLFKIPQSIYALLSASSELSGVSVYPVAGLRDNFDAVAVIEYRMAGRLLGGSKDAGNLALVEMRIYSDSYDRNLEVGEAVCRALDASEDLTFSLFSIEEDFSVDAEKYVLQMQFSIN